jgi:hypothetical protein
MDPELLLGAAGACPCALGHLQPICAGMHIIIATPRTATDTATTTTGHTGSHWPLLVVLVLAVADL